MAARHDHADAGLHGQQGIGLFAYRADLDHYSLDRLALLGDLRLALDRHELRLHYQPKVSLASGQVTGVEALVRWQHPERGQIPPDRFIPLAEHTALIRPLTLRIVDLALGQVRTWLDSGFRIPMAVNLSARNLLDDRLVGDIAGLLGHHELGIGVSIDDFGAGYTSLGQLKNLPVTDLKIDRSFVTSMDVDPSDALIVHSIIDLGHNLGFTVTAEGVTTSQFRWNPTPSSSSTRANCRRFRSRAVCRPASRDPPQLRVAAPKPPSA